MKTLLPDGWPRPSGYSNGLAVDAGQFVFVAGVIGWDEQGIFQSDNIVEQLRQVLLNTLSIMAEGGAKPADMVRMTWYVTDKHDYLSKLREIGETYREVMGNNYPVMACVEVAGLMEERAKIEIETTCVIENRMQAAAR